MPVKFELSDGSYVTLGWGLRERRQPIVRVSFDEGGRRTLMLASPAHARGWMADILHRGEPKSWPRPSVMRPGRPGS